MIKLNKKKKHVLDRNTDKTEEVKKYKPLPRDATPVLEPLMAV